MRVCQNSDSLKLNSFLTPKGRSPGEWIRGTFQRFRGSSPHSGDSSPSSTYGQDSPVEEETTEVIPTFDELLEAGRLSEASQQLIDRENDLFQEVTEEGSLQQPSVDRLAEDRRALEKHLTETLQQSLSLSLEDIHNEAAVHALTTALTSAVKAVHQEEEQTLLREQRGCKALSCWKKLHDSSLLSLVERRMENPLESPVSQAEQSSIQTDIYSMGRQLKQDLLFVVIVVKSCYPPQSNICQFYASLYHQTFSARLRKIADFGLEDKDATFLLRWVNEYYPGIFQKPELSSEIDSAALGKLLPKELLEPLEEQYLSKQKTDLSDYMNQVLQLEDRKWTSGEEAKKEDGCYTSPLAYDIIQGINGMVKAAEKVTGNRQKAQTITHQLPGFMTKYKHLQSVLQVNNQISHIKASLCCVEQFRDVLLGENHLFPHEVKEECLGLLMDIEQSAHSCLLIPIHKILMPQYKKLGTTDWLRKNGFEKLWRSLEVELLKFQDVPHLGRQELIGRLHQEVTEEYVRRLLRRDVKLKDREQQQRAYTIVTQNAESLNTLFSRMGSKQDWLKEILIKIAEVLRLQDVPALQMHIASLGSAHPDISEKHVVALLKLKTNISKMDRKKIITTLSDTLKETRAGGDARLFFSKVEIR
nr:tumor necrosis factor alpha-induced protein 2 [Nothobranchius furzeri]XP_054598069.1 tumor necrosis factor alpha-induced protein 2 [Nothobranchius furzeri]